MRRFHPPRERRNRRRQSERARRPANRHEIMERRESRRRALPHFALRTHRLSRRGNARRSSGIRIPRTPFLHGRRRCRTVVPRLHMGAKPNCRPPHSQRMPRSRRRRIYASRIPQPQARPLASRSHRRRHRVVVASSPPHRCEPNARRIQPNAVRIARKTARIRVAHRTRTRFQRRRSGICRPHTARRPRGRHQRHPFPTGRLLRHRKRHQKRNSCGNRRRAERRKIHPPQPPAPRRQSPRKRHSRHYTRRHRRHHRPRRTHLPIHRHSRNPANRRHHRIDGNRTHFQKNIGSRHRALDDRCHSTPRQHPRRRCRHTAAHQRKNPDSRRQQNRPSRPRHACQRAQSHRKSDSIHTRCIHLRQMRHRRRSAGTNALRSRPNPRQRPRRRCRCQHTPLRRTRPCTRRHPKSHRRTESRHIRRLRSARHPRMHALPRRNNRRNHNRRSSRLHLLPLLHRQVRQIWTANNIALQ